MLGLFSLDEWGCAMAWQPILAIENSQMQRHTGAAVESLRNEIVTARQGVKRVSQSEPLKEINQ